MDNPEKRATWGTIYSSSLITFFFYQINVKRIPRGNLEKPAT
jgi:hypothetical protein